MNQALLCSCDVFRRAPIHDYGDEFEYGLDIVLDGLEKVRSEGAA